MKNAMMQAASLPMGNNSTANGEIAPAPLPPVVAPPPKKMAKKGAVAKKSPMITNGYTPMGKVKP